MMPTEINETSIKDSLIPMAIVLAAGLIFYGISYFSYSLQPEKTPTPDVVHGELSYWQDDSGQIARVMRFDGEKTQMMSAPQEDHVKTGLTVHEVSFPSCGTIIFAAFDFGGIYGTAKPKSDEQHPDCPIKDWSGTWRMGWLM
jgi:hypothetical protein